MATIIDTIVAKRKAKDAGLNPVAPPAQPTPIFPVSSPKPQGNTSSALAIAEAKKTGENVYSPPPQIGTAYDSGVVPRLTGAPMPGIDPKSYIGGSPNADLSKYKISNSPQVAGVSSGATRAAPTVATPSNPAVTIGTAPSTTSPSLSMKDIAWKLSQKEPLTRDEFNFYYDEQTKAAQPKDLTVADIYQPALDESQRQIAEAQKKYDQGYKTEQELKAAKIAENNARIDAKYSGAITDAYSQGEQVKEASQQALSFSGFGRSTENARRQAEIEQKTQQAVATLKSQRDAEKALFEATANGESEARIAALGESLNALQTASAKMQIEAAQNIAEMNAANKVKGQEALGNLMKSLQASGSDAKIDAAASKLVGKLVKDDGTFVIGTDGQPIAFELGDSEKKAYQWQVNPVTGEEIVFDPNTAAVIQRKDAFGNVSSGSTYNVPTGSSAKTGATRAVRNNNPGNLRGGVGEISKDDGGFSQFATPEDGLNALVKDLQAKQTGNTRTGLTPKSSIADLLAVYAPKSDGNDPTGYAYRVAQKLGVPVSTPIGELNTYNLAREIVRNEDGAMFNILYGEPAGRVVDEMTDNEILAKAKQQGYDIYDLKKASAIVGMARNRGVLPTQELTPKDKRDYEKDLRNDLDTSIKAANSLITMVDNVNEAWKEIQSREKSGESINAASQGVLITFQKLIDQGSTVRTEEYNRSGDGQNLWNQVEGAWKKIYQGGAGLTAGGIKEFVDASNTYANGYKKFIADQAYRTQYIAEKEGLDFGSIITPQTQSILDQYDTLKDYGKVQQNISQDIGARITQAKTIGYTDKDILNSLLQKPEYGNKIQSALAQGYTPEEIVAAYLNKNGSK